MRDLIVTLIVLGLLPVSVMRPWIGLLLFSWISYMNPHRLTWGFAFDMPFAAMAAAATLLGILLNSNQLRAPRMTPVLAIWLAWVFWMNVTTPFALEPAWAVDHWVRSMKIQVMALLTLLLITDRQKLDALVWVIVGSLMFYGLKGGVFAIATGGQSRVWGPPGSFFEGNNELALALLMCLPLTAYLAGGIRHPWGRRGMFAIGTSSLFAIIATWSRGAFVAMAVTAAAVVAKSRHRVLALVLVSIAAPVVLGIMPDRYWDRIATIQNYEEDGSAMGRINAWMFAFNLAKDRPLVGGGFETFSPRLFHRYAPDPLDFHDAHSVYFEALAEHGFVGLFLFLGLMGLAYLRARKLQRLARKDADMAWVGRLGLAVQYSLIAYATGGAFLGMAYFDLFYHVIAILVITDQLLATRIAGSPTQRPETQGPLGSTKPATVPAQRAQGNSETTAPAQIHNAAHWREE